MTQFEKLDELVKFNNGIIRTSQVIEAEIAKPTFYLYVKEKGLEPMAHGIYASSDAWIDTMYILHLRCQQAIFSHDTALYLHDLTDREPQKNIITVKTGYNPTKLKADNIQVYTVKEDLLDLGRTTLKTPFGYEVPVYNMERTICDIVRSRNNIEIQTFQDALRQYTQHKNKNLRILMQYAKLFRVDRVLRQYLEVLL